MYHVSCPEEGDRRSLDTGTTDSGGRVMTRRNLHSHTETAAREELPCPTR
jgi:hypothetical protein